MICRACSLPVGSFRDGDGRILAVVECACGRISDETRAALPDWRGPHDWEHIGWRCGRGSRAGNSRRRRSRRHVCWRLLRWAAAEYVDDATTGEVDHAAAVVRLTSWWLAPS